MPLIEGDSKDVISENIREMMHAGHSQEQAVAASYKKARKGRQRRKRPLAKIKHQIK